MMILKTFGQKLKTVRENAGVSQEKLSELTGVVRGQISRIENGLINPTLVTIYKLSNALEIPLTDLLNLPLTEKETFKDYKIKPFVKWAGGKAQILDEIKSRLPQNFKTYFEPFIGGGALFFNLVPTSAVISDYNEELMSAYRSFQDTNLYTLMIEKIVKHEENHNEDYYYEVRGLDRSEDYNDFPLHEKAARLIYLNKACFNGLYRVNSKGYFNVPSGKKKAVNAYNQLLFDDIHEYLSNPQIKVSSGDFADAVKEAKAGDFVYFDPPYDTFEDQSNFTTYTKDRFGKDEQKRLADVFKELSDRGVYVMLSNHNTAFIRELYDDFNIEVIKARRAINAKGDGRGEVEEVIITNYGAK